MGIPFKITLPRFSIVNRDIHIVFSALPRTSEEKVNTIIDFWTIRDHKGRIVRANPEGKSAYFTKDQYGKKIELVMKDAGKTLSYDSLEICVHFLTQSGMSISKFYAYQHIGYKFSFTHENVSSMSIEEEKVFVDFVKKSMDNKHDDGNGNTQHQNNDDNSDEQYDTIEKLEDYIGAVDREMRYLKGIGGRRYKITNGQFVMQSQGGYVYSFDLDAELYLAEDSPVTVTVGLDGIPGVVLLCENFQVIVALERSPNSDKTLRIPKADISAEPWKLLEKLNERLRGINRNNRIALTLLRDGPKLAVVGSRSSIAKGQTRAIDHALTAPITVIWGPPGTGKTYTMAQIATEQLRRGKRVLIVSHSNVSVDNVAKQIYNQIKDGHLSEYLLNAKVLRYGYIRDEELQKNDYVSSFKSVIKNSSDKSIFEKLQTEYWRLVEESEISDDSNIKQRMLGIKKEIQAIKGKYKDKEKAIVSDAMLLATTVSKIYAEKLFENKIYDTVMFDEISMAYIPQIVAAASFAKEHLVCVGDFRQLSPIVQEKSAKLLLGKDLFEYLNISRGFRDINYHPWLVMLDEQRRMHPSVSAFPSQNIYNGLLKDHTSVLTNRNDIAKTEPFGQPMCLIDLYGTCCLGSKNEDNSRYNILSAVFAFATALKAENGQKHITDVSDEEKVGIITPYAAQTRLIKAMIQDHRQNKQDTSISCATVHQFQGSERNVIIFDAVESCPSTRAGWLMSKNEGGSVTRLVNVALTRTRGKFIAIVNKAFWLHKFDVDNMFYSLVKHMNSTSYILNHQHKALEQYIVSNDFGSSIKIFASTQSCNELLLDDIRSAKNKIVLLIPRGHVNIEYAKVILEEIARRSKDHVSVVIVYDKSAVVPLEYENISIPSDKITMPLLFIDKKVWYGLPIYRHEFSDSQVMYPIHADIIVRFTGKCTVEMIQSLVEHASAKPPAASDLALFVKNNCSCVNCGEPLSLVKASKHFLKCKQCGKTQVLTEYGAHP